MGNEQKREVDADGNEVISTSNDVWKTSVEVEHTENENMDDFINQLFLYSVSFKQREKRRFIKYTHKNSHNHVFPDFARIALYLVLLTVNNQTVHFFQSLQAIAKKTPLLLVRYDSIHIFS